MEQLPGHDLVGHVENGQEAIIFLERNQAVDVLVLDLHMPVMDGMQLLPHLNRKFPALKKMVLTGYHDRGTMQICRNLGVSGFVGKGACLDTFKEALQVVAAGGEYFQPVNLMESNGNARQHSLCRSLRDTYGLSDRETEVLQMILHQSPTCEIAEALRLSPLTVKTHRRNIFYKLKVHNLSGLLALIRTSPVPRASSW